MIILLQWVFWMPVSSQLRHRVPTVGAGRYPRLRSEVKCLLLIKEPVLHMRCSVNCLIYSLECWHVIRGSLSNRNWPKLKTKILFASFKFSNARPSNLLRHRLQFKEVNAHNVIFTLDSKSLRRREEVANHLHTLYVCRLMEGGSCCNPGPTYDGHFIQ